MMGKAMTAPQSTTPERIIRFTVDMPESLHQQLSDVATRLKRKKAVVVRMALEQALKDLDDDAVVG
jgi:predicted DNA-binding protein